MSRVHLHRFARLSDTALFCPCGKVKVIEAAACPLPHYPTYGWWSPWTYYPTYPNTYPTITGGTTGDFPNGTTFVTGIADDATYTVTSKPAS